MASSTNGRMAIPFSLKLSAPKKIQKKLPDPKAIQKILEKVDPNKAGEKKKDEQIKPEEESPPAPIPVQRPSESAAPLEGEDEPVSFSIGMERKRVSKLGKAATVRKPEPPVVTKPSLLPAPIEESWMNNDVEKVDPELRPSYNPEKKSEKKKEKSDMDSDSASESKKPKRERKMHKSSHSKHKDKESKSHSSHSKHSIKSSDSKSHSKSSKSHSDSKSSKSHSHVKSDSKPPKRKFRPVHNPPPINFQDLLKMAEEKQAEGVKIVEPVVIPKKKPEARPRTQEEINREARRKTKAYQDWLKFGGPTPSMVLPHSPNQSNEDSNGSAEDRDLGKGMERSQSKFGRQAEARKPKHPPKPKVDQGKVLIDSLFSDAVHIGTNSAKKPPKPENPERLADRPLENNGASSKDRHNSRQDGPGKFPVDRKGEKRSREDSNSRDSSEFSKRMKTSNNEHHSSHKHHNSHEHHSSHKHLNSHVSHNHSSHEHHSNHRNQHENNIYKHHSSHGGHSSNRNGNHPDKKPSEPFRGVPGSSKSGSPAVMNGDKTKVMAPHTKSGDKSKDLHRDRHEGSRPREHPLTGGKHLPQGASGSKPGPPSSSAGTGLSRPKETDSAGKFRPGLSSQGLRPPQVSRPGTNSALADRGASSEAGRPQQSAPRIIDCSPQSPPRKASKPSGPFVNPFDRIMGSIQKNHPKPVPKPRKRQVIESDEEDSSMDDFIDDEEEDFSGLNVSKAIKSIFRYDRTKYHDDDDDLRDMETSYSKQEAEERRSYRLGLKEDLEEERKEEMRKRQKVMMKKGYR